MKLDLELQVAFNYDSITDEVKIKDAKFNDIDVLPVLSDEDIKEISEVFLDQLHHDKSESLEEVWDFPLEEAEVEVDYTYKAGTPSKFDNKFGNFLPGEEADVDIESVKLGSIDILEKLSDDHLESLIDQAVAIEE